jgi:esterase FrsA
MMKLRIDGMVLAVAGALMIMAPATACPADEATSMMEIPNPLTFEQWKAEVQTRADRQIYPLIGIKPDEVRAALPQVTTPDRDGWARVWISVGDKYMAKAQQELAADRVSADTDFRNAWRYYNLARWPTLLSPAKKEAWDKAKQAFGEHGKLMDPPAETIHIPFADGRDIVGILRVPKRSDPAPLLITIGGLDGWRDDMVERFAALPEHGFAYIAVDAPGTGDSPVKGAGEEADRMFAKLIDWAQAQPNFDKNRIFVHGGSFGGHWASRLAILERARLRGAIDQSGPVDIVFDPKFAHAPAMLTPSFYLVDFAPSIGFMLGTKPGDDTDKAWAGMSLRQRGLLGQPTAPMLVVGGARDPLVPVGDLFAMMTSGTQPNEAWIHPQGLHMGRVPGVWRDEELLMKVMLPWLQKQSQAE